MSKLMFNIRKLFKPYPIRVVVYRKFQNALEPFIYEGRYEKVNTKTPEGVREKRVIQFFNGKNIVDIPNINLPYWFFNARKQSVHLIEIDLNFYLAVEYDNGVAYYQEPEYEMEDLYLIDNEGKPILENNEPVHAGQRIKIGKDGKPIIKGYKRRELMNANFMLENGQEVKVPVAKAIKTYDKEEWLSNRLIENQRLFAAKDFLSKYGTMIMLLVFGMVLLIGGYFMVQGITQTADKLANSQQQVAQQLAIVADRIADAAGAANPTIQPRPPS